MNDFMYHIPTKVYFGKDQLHHLGEELKQYGTRVLMTYGGGSIKRTGLYDRVVGIDEMHFALMAKKAVGGKPLPGFKPLQQADVEAIYRMCMK